MSVRVLTQGAGAGGATASIFVTGLDESSAVTATKDGKAINGVWNSAENCFEISKIRFYGMWTVTATDEENTTEQDVLVDAAVEYEIEMTYEPNYLMLYYLGDECTGITGGWSNVTGMSATKGATSMTISTTTSDRAAYGTTNKVDLSEQSAIAVFIPTATFSCSGSTLNAGFNHTNERSMSDTGIGQGIFNFCRESHNATVSNTYYVASINVDASRYLTFWKNATYSCTYKITTSMVAVFKKDYWQKLCALAGVAALESIADLLSNQEALSAILRNEQAVNYMTTCTGDFMALALGSANFLTAYRASPYKSTIDTNKHWSKFLAFVQ